MNGRVRVDWRGALSLIGTILAILSVTFLVPIAVALLTDGRDLLVFVVALVITLVAGLGLTRLDPDPDPGAREAFFVVAVAWLGVSLFGSIPYILAGSGELAHPVNALFESMSGFTTTGATVMGDISMETHSPAILMWRQLTQWLGGLGIVVLAVAILSQLSVGGAQLMETETPGPGITKLTPHLAQTARVLLTVYAGFTALYILFLYGLHLVGFAPNMTAYNAIAHGFTTLSTGGFSPEARSIQAFTPAVHWVVLPFMFIAGVNFTLFWQLITGDRTSLLSDAEFRLYLGVLTTVTLIGTLLLYVDTALRTAEAGQIGGQLLPSLRHAAFQVVSLGNSTGYASMDFNEWSGAAKALLVFIMFLGGSTGSTGGGVKVLRWLVIMKTIRRELYKTVHPDAVRPVWLNDRPLDEDAIRGIYSFTLLYLGIFLLGILLLALDTGRVGYELETVELVTTSIAMLGNIGPGLGAVGPMGSYLEFPVTSKILMIVYMWIGRLEIFPVLVLLTQAYWRS